MTKLCMKQLGDLPSALRAGAWLTLLTLPAAVAAYYRIFSGFAEWDDEGTLMMTVKQYLSGGKLYEEIYSGYGPVYYLYNWLVRSATGTALNHNAVRITSAVVAVVCSLICAWIVLQLTKSLAAASVAHLLVFRVLAFFTNEPGHPQELCMLLLVCLAGSGLLASKPRYSWLAMMAAGSIAAALTLIKINIGIFATLALGLAILFQSPVVRYWLVARYAVGCGVLVLPFVLMRTHLNDPAAQAYCLVFTASIAGVLAVAPGRPPASTPWVREVLAAVAGFAGTLILVLTVMVWQGVSMPTSLNMLVLEHVRINVSQGFWYLAVELDPLWIAWAMTGLAAALLIARARQAGDKTVDRLLAPSKVLFGGTGLLIALLVPEILLGYVTPFCWLLLLAPQPRQVDARFFLCALTVLQTLYAYPIAGSQTYFLRVLLVLVPAIALLDGLNSKSISQTPISRKFSRLSAAATLTVVALAYPLLAYRANRLYWSLTPLALPGAERIHLEKSVAQDYQWLVASLRQNCQTFVGLPGMPSLYFWTGKPLPGLVNQPPGPLNYDNWMYTLSASQQQAIVNDFSRYPGACAVYHPTGVDFWNKGKLDVRGWPLANYILTHFKTIRQTGDYQFMIRSERQLEIPTVARSEPPHKAR